ncbi:urease accessory protein UreD [Microvirga mediterraneensis]|uniref:Urease accessory protein UreD n=1 Tax=Microvirga mediterraneensis TaxID=2754695 RepID=A0A838BLC7_9HYPH|nr:urease accessory protein UreD [Microvirga mediterraneensis]MBA1156474.1 urease accessory protein UreD [Microvirga mediterraneensis]
MSVSAWPFDGVSQSVSQQRQRAVGRVAFGAVGLDGRTRPMRIEESGSMRIRLPKGQGSGLDAVLVNTAGGIACGDRFSVQVEVRSGATVTVATPAAEKVYRSDGPVAELVVDLKVAVEARLDWLPQETILFDRARLRRSLSVEMAENASLTLFEAVVFGREARAERIVDGLFEDRWRVRRGGRLVYADTLRLDGPIDDLLQKPVVGRGARVFATMIHAAPDAEARLDAAREHLSSVADGCDAAASAWNGLLAVRFCAMKVEALRSAAIPFLLAFRGEPLPRVWLS